MVFILTEMKKLILLPIFIIGLAHSVIGQTYQSVFGDSCSSWYIFSATDDNYAGSMQSDSSFYYNTKSVHGTNTSLSHTTSAVLFQNSPNPFSNTTTIEYYIPIETSNANLYVFNLTGELLQSYPISSFGNGQVIVSGSTLNAGMYIYSLVVDEQIVATKRMVLTK